MNYRTLNLVCTRRENGTVTSSFSRVFNRHNSLTGIEKTIDFRRDMDYVLQGWTATRCLARRTEGKVEDRKSVIDLILYMHVNGKREKKRKKYILNETRRAEKRSKRARTRVFIWALRLLLSIFVYDCYCYDY